MQTLTDCGCKARIHPDGSGVEIDFCPLHRAAESLLAALKPFADLLEDPEAAETDADGLILLHVDAGDIAAAQAAVAAVGGES